MIKYSMKSIDEIRKEIASAFRKMLPNNKETIKIEQPIQITTEKFEPKITESIEFLDNDGKNLRPHQIDALSRIKNESIGQVSIPTGTGKTLIQLHIHLQDMMEKSKNNQSGVYVITAHRLALCNQLFNDFVYMARFENNIECDFLSVSSDNYSMKNIHKSIKKRNKHLKHNDVSDRLSSDDIEVKNTTNSDKIVNFVNESKSNKKHCVIIATYDSFDRLNKIPVIDVCTYDEAHTITRDDYWSNVDKVKPRIQKQFFFTATRKESDCKRGMNRVDFYGELLFEKSPREMVEKGEIVRPNNYHVIKVQNDEGYSYDNPLMTVRAITEGFINHRVKVKEHSSKPKSLGAKLLVTCDGSVQLNDVVNDIAFRTWCKQNNVHMFSVNSEYGDFCNFERIKSRNTIIDKMNELSDSDDAIFLHVDILAEGIDLPAITGVMPIRDMTKSKLTQTLGRATRLLAEDRRRLYLPDGHKDKIYPTEYKKFVKPWAWVLIPNYLLDDANRIQTLIDEVYDNYGVRAERFTEKEQFMANPEYVMPSINTDDEIKSKFKEGQLAHIFSFSEMINLKTSDMSEEEQEKLAISILESYDA
jgi:superfamily II DNA or RNA helicase